MKEFSFLGAAERSRVQAAAAGTASGTFDFTFAHDATSTAAAPASTLSEDSWNTVLGYQPASSVIATPARGHGAFITLRVPNLRQVQAQPQPQPPPATSTRQARPVLSLIIPDNAAEVSAFSWSSDSDHPDADADADAYSASEYGVDLDSDNLSMHDAVEYQDEDIESLWRQVQESRRPGEGTYSPWARQLLDPWTPAAVVDEDEDQDQDEDLASLPDYEDEDEDFGILPNHEDQNEHPPTLPDYQARNEYLTIMQYYEDLIENLPPLPGVYQNADEASPDLGPLPDLEDADLPDYYEDADLPDYEDEDEDEDQDEPLTPHLAAWQLEDESAYIWWPNLAETEEEAARLAAGQQRSSILWRSRDVEDPWYPAWLDQDLTQDNDDGDDGNGNGNSNGNGNGSDAAGPRFGYYDQHQQQQW